MDFPKLRALYIAIFSNLLFPPGNKKHIFLIGQSKNYVYHNSSSLSSIYLELTLRETQNHFNNREKKLFIANYTSFR
jgi:hypothetical protein